MPSSTFPRASGLAQDGINVLQGSHQSSYQAAPMPQQAQVHSHNYPPHTQQYSTTENPQLNQFNSAGNGFDPFGPIDTSYAYPSNGHDFINNAGTNIVHDQNTHASEFQFEDGNSMIQ